MRDLSLQACLIRGQHYAAEWLAEHPKWMLSRWRCEHNASWQEPAWRLCLSWKSNSIALLTYRASKVGRKTAMKSSRFWLAAPVFALLVGGASANDELMKLSKDPNQWVMPSGDYANTRYSPLNQINKDNVKNLRPLWTFSTGVLRGHEGGPLVIGDVMYSHTPFPNNVFALDLNNNGRILWKYEPKQDPSVIAVMCCDTVNRGVAYADGKLFLNQADSTLVALDAKTGKVVVERQEWRPEEGRNR